MSRSVKGGKSGACPGCEWCGPKLAGVTRKKVTAKRKAIANELRDNVQVL
jgi:hypothetical protein